MGLNTYSVRSTDNYTCWTCQECAAPNAAQSIRRVMVVCASCALVHRVQSWMCACSQVNARGSRHCVLCDVPFALGCQELVVQAAQVAEEAAEAEGQAAAVAPRRVQRAKSRWQHSRSGWAHASIEAPAASTWCQDTTAPLVKGRSERGSGDARLDALVEKCRGCLVQAHALLPAGCGLEGAALTPEWVCRFLDELAQPAHRLMCPAQGRSALVPNPCVDGEAPTVQVMFEAVGMALALALTSQTTLQAAVPMWFARALIGYPLTLQDLHEFDAALFQQAENGPTDAMMWREEITRYGITKTFETEAPKGNSQRAYANWLKDIYLVKSLELPMKHIKHGFFYALMGDHLMQSLTPAAVVDLLSGKVGPRPAVTNPWDQEGSQPGRMGWDTQIPQWAL